MIHTLSGFGLKPAADFDGFAGTYTIFLGDCRKADLNADAEPFAPCAFDTPLDTAFGKDTL